MSFAQYCRLDVHCMQSDLSVVQRAQTRLKWPDAFKGKHRQTRKEFYRSMLAEHRKARALFTRYRF